ncbi:MAG: peptide-methionine (S)-S-oxide reductase MsrA [Chthoniobacterales bacterium]|nr:peptide-methionine (S)-S-oxide reductase MsrA [Chthoniobacterales bacterium]
MSVSNGQMKEGALGTLVVGAGCFWCVEAVYERLDGVLEVTSGFAGGHVPNPSYEEVCRGETGHAEVVKITYDPSKVSLQRLVEIFWQIHDPTDSRGVWPDFGPMYRSVLFASTKEEKEELERLRDVAQKNYSNPIVTEIRILDAFYPAEEYHQDFVRRNPHHPYVLKIAHPKVEKVFNAIQSGGQEKEDP